MNFPGEALKSKSHPKPVAFKRAVASGLFLAVIIAAYLSISLAPPAKAQVHIEGYAVSQNTPTCTDSDGGLNYCVKGYVTTKDASGNQMIKYDICSSSMSVDYANEGPYVVENYCDNGISKQKYVYCANGCKDGACAYGSNGLCEASVGYLQPNQYSTINGCNPLLGSSNAPLKILFVNLGNAPHFSELVNDAIYNQLNAISPFKENFNSMAFYSVEIGREADMNCKDTEMMAGSGFACDNEKIYAKIKEKCSIDDTRGIITVVVTETEYGGSGGDVIYIGSRAGIDTQTAIGLTKNVVIHEIGHNFGLGDFYHGYILFSGEPSQLYPTAIARAFLNVDGPGCSKWCSSYKPASEYTQSVSSQCLKIPDKQTCISFEREQDKSCKYSGNFPDCCVWSDQKFEYFNTNCVPAIGTENIGLGCIENTGCYYGAVYGNYAWKPVLNHNESIMFSNAMSNAFDAVSKRELSKVFSCCLSPNSASADCAQFRKDYSDFLQNYNLKKRIGSCGYRVDFNVNVNAPIQECGFSKQPCPENYYCDTKQTACSQKDFKMAFILVVKNQTDATVQRLGRLNDIKSKISQYFHKATWNLATMDTSVPVYIASGITPSSSAYSMDEIRKILEKFYQTNNDDYDFITIYTSYDPNLGGGIVAFHVGAFSIMGRTAGPVLPGKAKLKGANYIGNIDSFYGINNDSESALLNVNQILHETEHQWECYSSDLICAQAHYYFGLDVPIDLEDPLNGKTRWIRNSDGTYKAPFLRILIWPYNPFTLYFMGLLPESVYSKKFKVYDVGTDPNNNMRNDGIYATSVLREVSVNDIILNDDQVCCGECRGICTPKEKIGNQYQQLNICTLSVSPGSVTLDGSGKTQQITASGAGGTVIWSSSNASAVAVNSTTGTSVNVTSFSSNGSANITATDSGILGCSKNVTVTIRTPAAQQPCQWFCSIMAAVYQITNGMGWQTACTGMKDYCGGCSSCAAAPLCANECLSVNQMNCSGNYSQSCGNFDSDSCLEWGNSTYCPYGCSDGQCQKARPPQTGPPNTTICYNGVREGNEECDGSDLAGMTCASLGFPGGTLKCSPSCKLDMTGCIAGQCPDSEKGSVEIQGAGSSKTVKSYDGKTFVITLNSWDTAKTRAYLTVNGVSYTWTKGSVYAVNGVQFTLHDVDIIWTGSQEVTGLVKIAGCIKEISDEISDEKCKELISGHNKLNENRINLVFIAGGTPSLTPTPTYDFRKLFTAIVEGFKSTATIYQDWEGLKGMEPFASNIDKFNFWYIDAPLFGEDDPCKYIQIPTGATCNSGILTDIHGSRYDIKQVFALYTFSPLKDYCNLPNKFVHIFYKPNNYFYSSHAAWKDEGISMSSLDAGFGGTDFSTSGSGEFLHEFMHTFAGVWDEKGVIGKATQMVLGPDCFSLYPEEITADQCSKSSKLPWHDLIGNGCGKDGIVDCEVNTEKKIFDKFDAWIYEVRDDVEGCGQGCGYVKDNIYRPWIACTTMSSCDLAMKYGLAKMEGIYKLGVINEREACRKIRSLTGQASDYCKKLCLDGCEFGKRCIQGTCLPKENVPTIPAGPPTCTLTASPASGPAPLSGTLTWTTTGSPTSCIATGGWSGPKSVTGGSQAHGTVSQNTTYNLSCDNAFGTGKCYSKVEIGAQSQAPTASLTINDVKDKTAKLGDWITYRWSSTGANAATAWYSVDGDDCKGSGARAGVDGLPWGYSSTLPANTTNGQASAQVMDCMSGNTYHITYHVSSPSGQTAEDTAVVRVEQAAQIRIAGIRGFDPGTGEYTNDGMAGKYLTIFGIFPASGNAVLVNGISHKPSFESENQINVLLGPEITGAAQIPASVQVKNSLSKSNTYYITINPAPSSQPPGCALSLDKTSITLVGSGKTSSVTASGAQGTVSWSSSNAAIATVSPSTGATITVTSVAGSGSATITATDSGVSVCSKTISVTIQPSGCTNDCSPQSEQECVSEYYFKVCNDYDSDPCLEWSAPVYCSNKCNQATGQCNQPSPASITAAKLGECSGSFARYRIHAVSPYGFYLCARASGSSTCNAFTGSSEPATTSDGRDYDTDYWVTDGMRFELANASNSAVLSSTNPVSTGCAAPQSCTLTATPSSGPAPLSGTLTWTTAGNPTSCTATEGWSGDKNKNGGTQSYGPLSATTTYRLSCGTATCSATVTVSPPPASTASLTINGATTESFNAGDAWTLRLTTSPPLQNTPVTVCLKQPSASCTLAGSMGHSPNTNSTGGWSASGTFSASNAGAWTEYARVGAATSNDVTFTVQNQSQQPSVCTLAISPASLSFTTAGQTGTLTATGAKGPVTWSSSSPQVASVVVTPSGMATTVTAGMQSGGTTITATDTGLSGCTRTASAALSIPSPHSCTPFVQTVATGQPTTLSVIGGMPPYTWSAQGGTPASGSGSTFTTSFSTIGDHQVTVFSGGGGFTCIVRVGACNGPFDMSVADFRLTDAAGNAKTTFARGENIYPSVTLRSNGPNPACGGALGYFYISVYSNQPSQLSTPPPWVSSDVDVWAYESGSIAAGASKTYSVTSNSVQWTNDPLYGGMQRNKWSMSSAGTYTARVFADSYNYAIESNEANNQMTVQYTVT